MKTERTLIKINQSFAITIPPLIINDMGLESGDTVELEYNDDKVIKVSRGAQLDSKTTE